MIKRCNYTGRKKIPHKCIRIRVDRYSKTFEASWNLDGIDISASGEVYIEAFASGSLDVQRFAYGTVGIPEPGATDRLINGLNLDAIAFNFKVVDNSERNGCLLGISSNIKPIGDDDDGEDEARQQSILPINPKDLGRQVWLLNFSNNRPWLEVNNKIPEIMTITREDRRFFSLVYPSVIRQIFNRILLIDEWTDVEGPEDDWRVQWLKWGIYWHPEKERPQDGDPKFCREGWMSWIEDVADSFCNQHDVCGKFINYKGEDAGK